MRSQVRLDWNRNFDQPRARGRLEPPRVSAAPVRVVYGDNLSSLDCLAKELSGTVTLAYLDPPFFTGKTHALIRRKQDRKRGTIERTSTQAFDDRWESMASYLDALAPRLMRAFECLTEDGSLVLHVDPKASHYLKVLCDELFGEEHFKSEIIWRYRRWPARTPNFQRVHDVLLRYTKSVDTAPCFNQLYEPLAASTLQTWGKGKQRAVVDDAGRRRRSSTTPAESPGAPLGDVWEIGIVAPVAKERTGYPTQKPEALLERLLLSLTREGDLVLDPFAGSGTSLVVASRLGRRAIGLDQSPQAQSVIRSRLRAGNFEFTEQTWSSDSARSLAS